jgi:alpha-N-arabinofuranosidase
MKSIMRPLILVLLFGTVLAAQAAEPIDPSTDYLPALPQGKHWKLTWSDEFNGATLDTNKWEAIGDSKRRDAYWLKADSYLDGRGLCVLRTRNEGERYSSGAIRTLGKFEHRYGYWVARMKLPTQAGHWPAFWLMCGGVNTIGNEGRDGTEIDIVEVPWRDGTITYNLHWDGYGKEHKSAGSKIKIPELLQGFHTYSLNWTPTEYVIYVDGKELWRSSAGGVSQVPEYLKLTEEIGPWGGDIKKAVLPDYCYVDYVRVYDVAEGYEGSEARNSMEQHTSIRQVRPSDSQTNASLVVNTQERSTNTIPKFITAKFCEHLGNNIYNGMDAQILRNPTLADFPFWSGQASPDGVGTFLFDGERIKQELRQQAGRMGWPDTDLNRLGEGRDDGLACWWVREGSRDAIQVSPDAGPAGGRAQRIECKASGQGIAQWVFMPLHRTRQYEFDIFARSPNVTSLQVNLYQKGSDHPGASASIKGLNSQWQWFHGKLELGMDESADALHRLSITADSPGQWVVSRIFLRPADHVHGADPDVVRFLRDSKLPLLRWPGGNFVSGYHWQEGVGPVEKRPTRPNFAWGGVEPNTFGTDEFIAFCREIGCEPMICINAGDGSPEEAARWVEYCNGPATSPMGALRAANGHPEPYNVKHWEVGNELWGRWQIHWTTASGYVDRYHQFAPALLAADPSIHLYACGAPVFWGKNWNDTLIAGAANDMHTITDHPLIGGNVSSATDPMDVYRDFMAVPEVLETKWTSLRQDMLRGGVKNPQLAVTELQMFAHLESAADKNLPVRLTRENLVTPGTHGEALYDILIYHAAARLGSFVNLITHSATVNHGGGLRKEQEQVYANPCYFAQSAFAAFAGATPVNVEIKTPMIMTPLVLPELKNASKGCTYGAVDALAALAADGSLLLSIVHRGSDHPMRLDIALKDFKAADKAEMTTLAADVPWAANSRKTPDKVKPVESIIDVSNDHFSLELPPFSVIRVRVGARH